MIYAAPSAEAALAALDAFEDGEGAEIPDRGDGLAAYLGIGPFFAFPDRAQALPTSSTSAITTMPGGRGRMKCSAVL